MIRIYINKFTKKLVLRSLKNISKGTLSIIDGKDRYKFNGDNTLNAEITNGLLYVYHQNR